MSDDHAADGLVPRPLRVELRDGHVELPDGTVLTYDAPLRESARWWRRSCEDAFAVEWHLRRSATSGPVERPGRGVLLRSDPALPTGGYVVDVDRDLVDVRVADAAGGHSAVQTLRQLLGPAAYRRAGAGPVRMPCCRVEDAPRCSWRGVLLDVARHFMPKGDVLRFVELAAAHKLNVVQLHLTDDQGWRFEVRARPRLTAVGAWRAGSGIGSSQGVTPGRMDDTPHGGFYTQDDLREVVAHGARLGVTVVPEIDVPGHCQAAVAAYPELGAPGRAVAVRTTWGISDIVLRPTPATLAFFEGVLDEVLEVFDSPVICLGGDEVPTASWHDDPVLVRQAAELGLDGVGRLHGWFVGRLAHHLVARGRRPSVWDEAMSPDLPADTVVCAWRGADQGTRALNAGWDAVLSPEQAVYLDHRSSDGADEPVPVGFVRSVDDVYGFDPWCPHPSGPRVGHGRSGRLLGAQAAVWTEHLDSSRRVDFAAFPRLAAFAEAVWSDSERRDLRDFRRRLAEHHLPRLAAAGVEYRPADGPRPWQQRPGVPGRPRDLRTEQVAAGGPSPSPG